MPKIAILGGGMAGLTAAYELSKLPGYDITVHQMGWRLGGKAASGRDRPVARNLEHGLHMWFGCYHNVFKMTREVYAAWNKPTGCPLQTIDDVAKKQSYTPLGVRKNDGTWTYFPMHWPENNDVPGTGGLGMTPSAAFASLLNLFSNAVESVATDLNMASPDLMVTPAFVDMVLNAAAIASLIEGIASTESEQATWVINFMELGRSAFNAFAAFAEPVAMAMGNPLGLKIRVVRELFDIMVAATRGYYTDLAIPNRPYEAIDHVEFRAWLISHGATPSIVNESSIVHILYDTMFQYIDGDVDQPSYAAGTALGVLARLIGTFKGAVMWDIQAGMGEAVVAPLYEVLKARGVKFEFFHKVKKLVLSPDRNRVERILLDVQARVLSPPYKPVKLLAGVKLRCWPKEPIWSRLANGAALKARGVNFESHWCSEPPAAQKTLRLGADFDQVILAIAMGAYKPLNTTDGSLCDELIANDSRFERFVTRQHLVPSQGLQLWSDWTLAQLGWTTGHAAMVGGPQYLNIWADMTQVLQYERWPNPRPQTLHYLTGTFKTQLHKQPSTNTGVPAQAHDQLRSHALDWLNRKSDVIFPLACDGTTFDYAALKGSGVGAARFDEQFLRANIDPTECCVASAAGTTQFRLYPRQHRYANLVLAGEATRQGFNTTTIEGAVMSGMAAARAISGQPVDIVGYDFLTTPL